MIVTWRIGLRIALLIVAAVVLQVSFFSYVPILGAVPDVVTVVVISLGLLGGGVIGAVCGFATGFVLDSALLQALGVSSLILLTVGYLAGRFRESFEISGRFVVPLVTAGLTVLGAFAFSAAQLTLGVETQVSLLVVRDVLVKGLLAFALAFAVFPLVRRALRPAIVEDLPTRRVLTSGASRRRGGPRRGSGARLGSASRSRRGSVLAGRASHLEASR